MVEVVDADASWPRQFDELRSGYVDALEGVPVVAIEHVGSTSVPGLAAKPVIDIDIVVLRRHIEPAGAALEAIGFEPIGEQGIVDRFAFRAPPGPTRTNTYVVVDGSVALRNHRAVRDALRADTALRDEYATLKRRLAAESDDIGVYIERKSALIQRILTATEFSPAELADIDAANRTLRGVGPPPHRLVSARIQGS